jgi:phage-related protein (TIGR01555 family)
MARRRNNKRKHTTKRVTNQDSYENMFTGLNQVSDHTTAITPGRGLWLDDVYLTNIYTSDGLGSRIIKLLPHDMVKNGYRVSGDTDNIIVSELKRLKAKKHTMEALNWARTYGGAITVVGVDDGKKLDKPMGKRYTKIQWMKTVSKTRIDLRESDRIKDPNSPYFGEYEYYHISFDAINGSYEKVHRSRCLIYKGETCPDDPNAFTTYSQRYWGLSAMQAIWDQLKQLGGSFQGMAHLMNELCIGKYKLKDLATLLSSANAELIVKRLELINQSKSMINGVVLDAESEDYIRDMVNVSGSDKILEQFMIMLSAATGYPVTILFGRSPDGMNATGESDLSNYDSMVESAQETKLEEPQQRLVQIINNYKKVDGVDSDPVINFNPVRSPTLKEMVDARHKVAETDKIYIDTDVLTPEQVADMRFAPEYDMYRMDMKDFLNPDNTSDIDRE